MRNLFSLCPWVNPLSAEIRDFTKSLETSPQSTNLAYCALCVLGRAEDFSIKKLVFILSLSWASISAGNPCEVHFSDTKINPRLEEITQLLIKATELEKHDAPKPPLKDPSPHFRPMTEEAFMASLHAKRVPQMIIDSLALVNVEYRGFDGHIYSGQIVVHKQLASSIRTIFSRILNETDFPIASVIPIDSYYWSDALSIEFNNSSGFNWRLVANTTEFSDHGAGAAVDMNPQLNPLVREEDGHERYNPDVRGTLHAESAVVKIFKEAGWKWGGDWVHSKDYQHFYRPEIAFENFGKIEVNE